MCQLLALQANAPTAVTFSWAGLAARGGETDHHADGFGLAFHDEGACRLFIDQRRASDAALARALCEQPLRARTVLAHVRKATQGAVGLANCHPFVREWGGRHWSFCHNGDLKDFHPRLDGSHLPVGSTDSERAFCLLLQQLRRRFRATRRPAWQDIARLLADSSEVIARHGSFNYLLSDGELLFAHASTSLHAVTRAHPFGRVHLVDRDLSLDLAAHNAPGDRMVLLATRPLTRDESWSAFAPGELRVYREGEELWRHVPAPQPLPAHVHWPLPV